MLRLEQTRYALDFTTSLPRNFTDVKRKWIKFPYLGNIPRSLSQAFRPLGFRLAVYNTLPFKKLFPNLKDPVLLQRSGVYKLFCNDCNGVYIGETGRSLETRIVEHTIAWMNLSFFVSTFADHLIQQGHGFEPANTVILHSNVNSWKKRIALENFEILTHAHDNKLVYCSFCRWSVDRKQVRR